MLIIWDSGSLEIADAWIENKAEIALKAEQTITGDTIVFLPALEKYKIFVNRCTYEEAQLIKSLAKSGITVSIDDEGFQVQGKITEVKLEHFVKGIKEPAIRQRANIYKGTLTLEGKQL